MGGGRFCIGGLSRRSEQVGFLLVAVLFVMLVMPCAQSSRLSKCVSNTRNHIKKENEKRRRRKGFERCFTTNTLQESVTLI